MTPSVVSDLLPRRQQPSHPQHPQRISRGLHGVAREVVLFHICLSYWSHPENRSSLVYCTFLSIPNLYLLVKSKNWLQSSLCPVSTFRSAMARSTLYSQCLWFSPFIFTTIILGASLLQSLVVRIRIWYDDDITITETRLIGQLMFLL